ncbi:hypothetical protein [uncultured Winogradskyella sp.]|uniref:hypothetical protein n=1 Tax=uncultured Winogradskyella sp. TaxID=395353 RepID=UPI002629C40F|nr:hypothetical protein [uncultured Winogradskyella sp.]
MIGDKLTYHASFKQNNLEVIAALKDQLINGERLCIAVGGESGSGKTSLAYALLLDIETELNLKGYMFHLDDYFFLPPKDNHNKRLEAISNVGVSEVNLERLDLDLERFLSSQDQLKKPLVNYQENTSNQEIIYPSDFHFCLVEGTYTMLLKQPAYKIFIENSFKETKANREKRGRDIMDDFNEKVLEIEHNIIKAHAMHADKTIRNNSL